MRDKLRLMIALLTIAIGSMAFGQAQTTGRIAGRVVDDAGAAVSGATVNARNNALSLERTTTTVGSGDFQLAQLPNGSYTVTVTAPGKQPEVYNVDVRVGETVPLNVQLAPGDVVAEAITVTAAATALETTSVGQDFSFEEEVEVLPMPDRDLEDIALFAPNVSHGPTGGTLQIAGAPSFDTIVLLDGAEISDPYFGSAPTVYLEDAIDEIQVLTSGISARYGRFQGGVINAVTKSGTNEFRGSFRTELESQSWNSQSPAEEVQSDDVSKVYSATLGGPLVRDHLWFFVGGRKIPASAEAESTVYTDESISTTRDEQRWQVKLSASLGTAHYLDLSHLDYESAVSNYVGLPAGDDLAVGRSGDPRQTDTFNYHGLFGGHTYVEGQATRKRVQVLSGGDPGAGDPFIEIASDTVFNNGWWDFSDPSVRNADTLSAGLSRLFNAGSLGTHNVEVGVQRVVSTTAGQNRQSATGFNLLAYNVETPFVAAINNGVPTFNVMEGEAVRWEALPLEGEQKLTNLGLYVQDSIEINRLRLDLGLRYDSYDGSGPIASFNLDFAGWGPRLGATYSITPNWQVQATYGRYISRFNDNVGNSVTGVSGAPRIITVYTGPTVLGATGAQVSQLLRDDRNWGIVAGYTGLDQPTVFADDELTAPYADDINLSIRHGLPANAGSFVVAYSDRTYKQLIDDFTGDVCSYGFEFALPCPTGNIVDITDPASGDPLATLDSIVWANEPRARRKYRALTGVLDYRPSSRLQLGGNYTYAITKANYEGEGQNTPASGSIFGDYERGINIAAAAPYGYADDDIRHRANAFASYALGFDRLGSLTFGSILRYESGRPYNLVASVPISSVAEYAAEDDLTYTYFFGPNGEVGNNQRGARRFNDWWALDLSARYAVPIIAGVDGFVRLVVTNALDNNEVIRHSTVGNPVFNAAEQLVGWTPRGTCGLNDAPSASCSGFGRIRNENDYQRPREFQVSLGLTF
jgi:Carboxypeptidase regulatory-like domain/TonB dependent receptor